MGERRHGDGQGVWEPEQCSSPPPSPPPPPPPLPPPRGALRTFWLQPVSSATTESVLAASRTSRGSCTGGGSTSGLTPPLVVLESLDASLPPRVSCGDGVWRRSSRIRAAASTPVEDMELRRRVRPRVGVSTPDRIEGVGDCTPSARCVACASGLSSDATANARVRELRRDSRRGDPSASADAFPALWNAEDARRAAEARCSLLAGETRPFGVARPSPSSRPAAAAPAGTVAAAARGRFALSWAMEAAVSWSTARAGGGEGAGGLEGRARCGARLSREERARAARVALKALASSPSVSCEREGGWEVGTCQRSPRRGGGGVGARALATTALGPPRRGAA